MEVDPRKLNQVAEKADYVIEQPTPKQILKYLSKGDRIAYVGTDDLYRSGGFIMTISEDGKVFSLLGGKYRWSVRTENLDTIFITKKIRED